MIKKIVFLAVVIGGLCFFGVISVMQKEVAEQSDESFTDFSTVAPIANTTSENASSSSVVSEKMPAVGIPLQDLPLTDAQKDLAGTFGIDVDTFVISPAMISCAQTELGTEQFEVLMQGQVPSFFEGVALMGCLGE